jgi:hypothetical protein
LRQEVEEKTETIIGADQNPEKVEVNPNQGDNWNVGTVARPATLGRIAGNRKRRMRTTLQMS